MEKIFILLLLSTIFITGCKQNEVINTHGVSYLEKREKLIFVNKSNKNDTIKVFGNPATKGLKNDNLWIYIERTHTKSKLLKLGRNYIKKNNVLVLEFDKYGVLKEKKFYDKNDMKKIKFAKQITENEIKKENFVYSFLSSLRTKMESKRK